MAHQYRQHILVRLGQSGEPATLFWRGAAYVVAEVLARWHLRDRWWEAPDRTQEPEQEPEQGAVRGGARASAGSKGDVRTASDRHYYRLRCADGLLCEVYWDAASGAWVLDRVLD